MNKDVATSEKGMKTKKISRRSRGRNIVQTIYSDYDDEMKSVTSDNPNLYTRSRSSYFLDNTMTKKQLLQYKGKTFANVETKMKTIEQSLGNKENKLYKPIRNEARSICDIVQDLKNQIQQKEQIILQIKSQMSNCKQDRTSHELELLENQMDAKILQTQDKHAKVSRLKLDG